MVTSNFCDDNFQEKNVVTYRAAMKISNMAKWGTFNSKRQNPKIFIFHEVNISDRITIFLRMCTNNFRLQFLKKKSAIRISQMVTLVVWRGEDWLLEFVLGHLGWPNVYTSFGD